MQTARSLAALALPAALLLFPAAPAAAAHRPNPHADLDCNYCHLDVPRFGVDTRETVTFWRAEGDEPWLCERCHGPDENLHPLLVAPGPERLGTHIPAVLPLGETDQVKGLVVCTTCHFIHAADADHALLRGLPGSDRPRQFEGWQDLCRDCHGLGLEQRSPHAGDERSCAFCHAARPEPGQEVRVLPVGRRLCGFCHGGVDETHYRRITPVGAAKECTDCHDPHLGKDHPGRLKAGYYDTLRDSVRLDPHGRRTACFGCHADPAGKKLRGADVVQTCQRCHASGKILGMSHPMDLVPAGFTVPAGWPLADGRLTCITCHLPGHVGDGGKHYLRFQGERRTDVCFRCHRRVEGTQVNPHMRVAREKEGCEVCHARKPVYGTDTRETVTFRAGINIVCLSCHDVGPHPGGVDHTQALPPDTMIVPETFPLADGRHVTCATCHNPHISPEDGTNLRGLRNPQAFCSRCHRL